MLLILHSLFSFVRLLSLSGHNIDTKAHTQFLLKVFNSKLVDVVVIVVVVDVVVIVVVVVVVNIFFPSTQKLSPEAWLALIRLPNVHVYVQEADYAFYQHLVDVLLPDVS